MKFITTLEVFVSHDQLFKDVLRTFFPQFLQLFFPTIARDIDLDAIAFRESEIFTDIPEGERRIADMVAQVRTRITDALVLLHAEFQGQKRADLGYRLWKYNVGLRLRDGLPVISIALVLSSGTPGISLEFYEETLFGHTYTLLEYWQIGLRDLDASDYLSATQDLAIALAALMRSGPMGRAGLKLELLRRLKASTLDEARLFLLLNMVESYLRLETAEIAEMTWADEMMARGRAQGIEQEKRDTIVRIVRLRFTDVPTDLPARLARVEATRLDSLLDRVVLATNLEEFLTAL